MGLNKEDDGSVKDVFNETKIRRTKKEIFKRYLEKSGVSSAILRALVLLYEDEKKPNDPIRYICQQLGFGIPEEDEIEALQNEVVELRKKYQSLTEENEKLNFYMQPKEDEIGLDEETQELLRRQEAELAKIQRRQECILKAYEGTKFNESKMEGKPKHCIQPPAPAPAQESMTENDELPRDSTLKLLVQKETGLQGLPEEVEEQEGTPAPPATPTDGICSPDEISGDESLKNGIVEAGNGELEDVTTIIIPVDELRNQPHHSCGNH